jgi:hypothetical protein
MAPTVQVDPGSAPFGTTKDVVTVAVGTDKDVPRTRTPPAVSVVPVVVGFSPPETVVVRTIKLAVVPGTVEKTGAVPVAAVFVWT